MHMNSSRNMFVARCSAIFLVVAALCGNGVAWTAEYALNIDAKPIVLRQRAHQWCVLAYACLLAFCASAMASAAASLT